MRNVKIEFMTLIKGINSTNSKSFRKYPKKYQ
jgi:hypothetical protein